MTVISVEKPEKKPDPPYPPNEHNASTVSWHEFTENTTFHGVKYIFQDSRLSFRRPIWFFMVATSIVVFIWQVGIRTGDYFQYKTTTDVEMIYKEILEFPAVTICNQNSFRLTATVDWGLYDVIDTLYKTSNISNIDWSEIGNKIADVNYTGFINTVAHQKASFIDSCQWNGNDCDIENDFKMVLTSLGVCYTFNHGDTKQALQTTEAGQGSGLKLMINVEQYEYMRGPQDDAGIKVLLHPRNEAPMISEHGFAAAPGAHTLVAMKRYEVHSLEPPFGICHPDNFPVAICLDQCRVNAVVDICGCRAVYMTPNKDNSTELKKKRLNCQCNPPCIQVSYEQQLSNAQMSKFNIDRMILDNPAKKITLQQSFQRALDTSQQWVAEIWAKDVTDMSYLLNISSGLYSAYLNNEIHIMDPAASANISHLPDIFASDFGSNDEGIITAGYHATMAMATSTNQMTIYTYGLHSVYQDFHQSVMWWNGSSLLFPEALEECVAAAADTYQSSTKDSKSKDTKMSWDEYAISTCKAFTEDRKSAIESKYGTVFSIAEANYENSIRQPYEDGITAIFDNSPTSPDNEPSHQKCMNFLNCLETISAAFRELKPLITAFWNAAVIDDYVNATKGMEAIFKLSCMDTIAHHVECTWLLGRIVKEYYSDNSFMALVQMVKQSQNQISDPFVILSSTLAKMKTNHAENIDPLLVEIEAYLNGTSVKSDLAAFIQSQNLMIALAEMPSYYTDFYNSIKVIQSAFTDMRNNVQNLYSTLLGLTVPLVRFDKLHQMSLFRAVAATDRADLNALAFENSTNVATNLNTLLDMTFSEYKLKYQQVLDEIGTPFSQQLTSLTAISNGLREYTSLKELNTEFFMENFLKLDVFFKDMSYEAVSQQEVFSLPSLFGEVGGFMGLLLGASVLTVCELCDYIIVNIVQRVCMKPSKVNVREVHGSLGWLHA